MPNSAVSHIQQQYAAHHPRCNTFALDKPKSAAYGYTAAFIAFNNADGTPTNETLTLDTIHAAAEACQVIDMGFDYTPYYDGEPVNPPTCHLIMGTNFGESNKKYALSSLYGTARIYLITADAPTVKVDGFMTKLSMFVNKMRNSETWNRAKAYILSTSPAGEELQSFACSFTTFAMPRKYIVDHEKPWRPEKEIVVNNSLQMAFRPGIFWPKQSAVDPSRPLTVRASEGPATFESISDLTCGGVPVEKTAKALEKRQNINTYIYHFAYPKNLGEQPNLTVVNYMVDVLALHLRELDKLQLAPNAQPPLEWTMEDMLFSSAFVVQDLAEQSGVPEGSHLQVPSGQPRQRTPHTSPKRPAPAQSQQPNPLLVLLRRRARHPRSARHLPSRSSRTRAPRTLTRRVPQRTRRRQIRQSPCTSRLISRALSTARTRRDTRTRVMRTPRTTQKPSTAPMPTTTLMRNTTRVLSLRVRTRGRVIRIRTIRHRVTRRRATSRTRSTRRRTTRTSRRLPSTSRTRRISRMRRASSVRFSSRPPRAPDTPETRRVSGVRSRHS